MSNFRLNFPTDIPWERICVTEDMIAQEVCDERLPAKWQSSLGVFKFRPDDEFQQFPKYNITYLKVTATITGYQPLDKEVQGNIDWDGLDVSTVSGLNDLLNTYNPCHGAILQVVVGPHEKKPGMTSDDYPFIMDFEPKKRELYELATDTQEKSSRSIESLNIRKSAGSTQSMEVLDVDMGGGGFGIEGSGQGGGVGGGGGFNYTAPSGQWGTKRLNADESMQARSSDVGQEKRENFSFSTQLSQMYHLLNSYHLGTNRTVFFIQPRPHTLEEPSGFVKGPRPVEGIQEFFLVVAQPKDQEDFCVSLRLDTSHLTKTPIMDFERKTEISDLAIANAPIPTKNDELGGRERWGRLSGTNISVYYQCYRTTARDDKVYLAPTGFEIESYNDIVNFRNYGESSVTISPDRSSLTISATATGKNCFRDSFCPRRCPDEWQKRPGEARRQVDVNLVSKAPIRQVGEEEVLMITTRGLCCCASDNKELPLDEFLVDIIDIPYEYILVGDTATREMISTLKNQGKQQFGGGKSEKCEDCNDNSSTADMRKDSPKYSIRQANGLSDWIKSSTIRSLNDPTVKLKKYTESDFFVNQLELKMIQMSDVRKNLDQDIIRDFPKSAITKLEKRIKKKARNITRADLLTYSTDEIQETTGLKADQIRNIKLGFLGVKFRQHNAQQATSQQKKGKKGK